MISLIIEKVMQPALHVVYIYLLVHGNNFIANYQNNRKVPRGKLFNRWERNKILSIMICINLPPTQFIIQWNIIGRPPTSWPFMRLHSHSVESLHRPPPGNFDFSCSDDSNCYWTATSDCTLEAGREVYSSHRSTLRVSVLCTLHNPRGRRWGEKFRGTTV